MQKALTDRTIEALKPQPDRYEVHDLRCPGLTLRVSPKGRKSFYIRFRYGLLQKHPMIGVYPRMSLATAREKANDWLRQADEGIDPSERKRSSNMKVEAVCREFVRLHAQARNKSWREAERILDREFVGTFGQRDIRDIKRFDVLEIMDAAVARGSTYQANRILSNIRKLFNWCIGQGASWIAAADITGFFTKIPKSTVTGLIRSAINDDDLMALLEAAINVELANLSELRKFADQFPIEDIGVAQGNSLSPLLGNILLAAFDNAMNEGDCRCIRYIDDFIILAPTRKAADARLRKAKNLLKEFDMELAPEKSSRQAHEVSKGFEFLGIEISPGFVRPAKKARTKFLKSIHIQLDASKTAITDLRHGHKLDPKLALIATLKRIDGMIDGWGKHYWFCNDRQLFHAVDEKIRSAIGAYLGTYSDTRSRLPEGKGHLPLGLMSLGEMERSPFAYPRTAKLADP